MLGLDVLTIGDRVTLVRAATNPPTQSDPGIAVAILESDERWPDFNMCAVRFDFGTYSLYGAQLRLLNRLVDI